MAWLLLYMFTFIFLLFIYMYRYYNKKEKNLSIYLFPATLIGIAYIFFSSGNLTSVTKYDISYTSQLTISFISIVVIAAAKLYLQKRKNYKLPGPVPWPVIGNAHLLAGASSDALNKVTSLLNEYNGLMTFWVGPELFVVVSEPEHLEIFCNHPSLQNKSHHYGILKPLIGESIFTSNGETWKQGRKLILPCLRPAFLKNLMPSFNGLTQAMITRIGNEVGKDSFDVFPYLRDTTYSMIFEPILGRKATLENSSDTLQASSMLMDLIYQRGYKLWLRWDPLYFLLPAGKRYQAAIKKVKNYYKQHVLKSMQLLQNGEICKGKEGQILVENLFNKIGTDQSKIETITNHVHTMIDTGYDTTAGTMGFVLMMLGIHQDIQQNVYEEVSRVNSSAEDGLTSDDLLKLEYLDRVIKETLRIYPSGPIIFRDSTDEVKIGDLVVPKGVVVVCVFLGTHRNPLIYPDPLKFNPDNFLPERVAQRHPYAYLPFSAGSRGCIGERYGMMTMKLIMSQLIANYKIFCDVKMEDIRLDPKITLKVEGGFKIRIEKR